MTYYDKVIDTISSFLFEAYKDGELGESWDEEESQRRSKLILECVEEFQSLRSNIIK